MVEMKSNRFAEKIFKEAHQIHVLCDKLGLSKDNARLFTYIHYKISSNNYDYNYFEKEDLIEIEVLEFLLDNKKINFSSNVSPCFLQVVKIPRKLKELDNHLRERYGMEIRIQSELMNRLRIHTDRKYKSKMMQIYKEKILPHLKAQEN